MLVSDPGSVVFFGHEVGQAAKLHEVLKSFTVAAIFLEVLFLPRRLLAGTSCGPRCSISFWSQEQGEIRNEVSSSD